MRDDVSRPLSPEGRDNFDRVFRRKTDTAPTIRTDIVTDGRRTFRVRKHECAEGRGQAVPVMTWNEAASAAELTDIRCSCGDSVGEEVLFPAKDLGKGCVDCGRAIPELNTYQYATQDEIVAPLCGRCFGKRIGAAAAATPHNRLDTVEVRNVPLRAHTERPNRQEPPSRQTDEVGHGPPHQERDPRST